MKDNTIDVLMVVAGVRPCQVSISGTYKNLKYLVNPSLSLTADVEAIMLKKDVALIYNSEGYLLGLKGNRKVNNTIIAGTFFIVGVKEGVISSLSKEKQEKYFNRFAKIEKYTEKELSDSYWNACLDSVDKLPNQF